MWVICFGFSLGSTKAFWAKGIAVLADYSNRAVGYFAVDYDHQFQFAHKLADAAQALYARLKPVHLGVGPDLYIMRDPPRRLLAHIGSKKLYFQTLGSYQWTEFLTDIIASAKAGIETLGVRLFQRIGFRISAFLPLKMTHAEICDLAFGGYLVPKQDLADVAGPIDDLLVQLYGTRRSLKTRLSIAPQTAAQASASFLVDGNLEAVLEHKWLDPGLREFHERIAADSLWVDIDLYQTEKDSSLLEAFLEEAVPEAMRIIDAAVARLMGTV